MPVERLRRLPRPSRTVSRCVSVALVVAWATLRLGLFFPVTYTLPLLVGIWSGDVAAVWAMAGAFIGLQTAHHFWLSPPAALGQPSWAAYLATLVNILAMSAAVHLVIRLRQVLEAANQRVHAQAAELQQQGEELAQQNEELLEQSEETSSQAEELARQNEELQSRTEEIQALNLDLAGRERLLQRLLDAARLSGSEQDALDHVTAAAMELFGDAVVAVVVYEREGSQLALRASAGPDRLRLPDAVPAADRFASLVMAEGRTAALNDAALRPDLTILAREGVEAPGAMLASPLMSAGSAFGALAVYSRVPCEWTREQFALAEWLAGRCAQILSTLRLQASLRRQAALLDLSPDAILVRDVDGTVRFWSLGAERLYGWTAEQATGRRSQELLASRFPQPFDEIAAVVAREGAWLGRVVNTAKDGREVVVESRWLAEQRHAGGELLAVLESNVEITARERAEAAVREADRRKDEFLATLSHELRNPLAPMRHAVSLLHRDSLSSAAEAALAVLERQLAHLVRLVDELLDLTRVQSDKIQLQLKRVDLCAVVEQALEAARPALDSAGHSLETVLAPQLLVDADPDRVAQALTNLLNNAMRYTPSPGRITLSAERSGDEALIAVTDTGIGLEAEDLERVFDMFTQVGGPGHGGLGIGLALIRRIVRLHGGSVTAHSEGRGRGARFELRLPIASGAAPADTPLARVAAEAPAPGGACRRVLVVDDNADAADMVGALLGLAGHQIKIARDAGSALAALDGFDPEVALLDIGLPGIDGYELAGRLREDPRCRDIYLIAVTGWGQEQDRRKASDAGFDAHLTKPADPEVLQRLVARLGAS